MNGDRRDDLLGTWDGQGVFYRDSITSAWVKMASPATLITTGDVDGDRTDDLIGIWPTQGGVWVKYSGTGAWELLGATARGISTGRMRPATEPEAEGAEAMGVKPAAGAIAELTLPIGGVGLGPETAAKRTDLSADGPGGARFVYLEDRNLEPKEEELARPARVPGPGEPGAKWVEQENLFPQETSKKEGKKAIKK